MIRAGADHRGYKPEKIGDNPPNPRHPRSINPDIDAKIPLKTQFQRFSVTFFI